MLTVITFLPLLGALLVLLMPREQRANIRWVAFVFALLTLTQALPLLAHATHAGGGEAGSYFLQEKRVWMGSLGVTYHLALDGLSYLMVLLTALLTVICIAASFAPMAGHDREREYYLFLLALESGVIGTFLAVDLALFYVFWELMLIPLYFLIGLFGSKNRIHATVKFLLFTFAGSVFMLIAILYLYAKSGEAGLSPTTNLPELLQRIGSGALVFSPVESFYLFLGFFIAFAIKVPLFPLHTWLPDAHTEAPTAGSVMLAGVLLKTGVYGIVRFCLPLFPEAAIALQPTILALSTIAIVYGALGAIAQSDMKRLVAYSSVSHMGFIVLGVFAFNEAGMTGALLQMLNHGISTSGLFLCVGMLYERRHTRDMAEYGGIAGQMKVFSVLTMLMLLSSVGLPGLNGFVGEFWILAGSFAAVSATGQALATAPFFTGIAATGVVLGAVYLLTFYRRVFFGELDETKNGDLKDCSHVELYYMLPLVVLAVWIGVYSKPFTDLLAPSSRTAVASVVQRQQVSPGDRVELAIAKANDVIAASATEAAAPGH